jgi:hypothetical protein
MSNRNQEAWGGEVRMPRWLRRMLRRPEALGDTPEAAHEKRKAVPGRSVVENADRAAVGVLSELYRASEEAPLAPAVPIGRVEPGSLRRRADVPTEALVRRASSDRAGATHRVQPRRPARTGCPRSPGTRPTDRRGG